EVTVCGSAQQALARISDGRRYDVVISDIEMPEMNGFEFAEAVRATSDMQDVPIIALSSLCTPEAIERGRSVGFTDYVAKSDRAGLVDALKDLAGDAYGEAA